MRTVQQALTSPYCKSTLKSPCVYIQRESKNTHADVRISSIILAHGNVFTARQHSLLCRALYKL